MRLTLGFVLFLLSGSYLRGQAATTANRGIGFDFFVAGSQVNTDYGSTERGITVGFDTTRHFRKFKLFDAGLEARTSLTSGPIAQRTYFVGPRLEHKFRRIHTYGDFLVGRGSLGPQSASVSGGALAFGGGVDFDLSHRWSLKLDYSKESWKLPTETNRLTPGKVSVGIVWRFTLGGDKITR